MAAHISRLRSGSQHAAHRSAIFSMPGIPLDGVAHGVESGPIGPIRLLVRRLKTSVSRLSGTGAYHTLQVHMARNFSVTSGEMPPPGNSATHVPLCATLMCNIRARNCECAWKVGSRHQNEVLGLAPSLSQPRATRSLGYDRCACLIAASPTCTSGFNSLSAHRT